MKDGIVLRRVGASGGAILAALLCASYLLGGPMPRAGTPPAQLVPFLAANSSTQEWSWFLACGPVMVIGPWFAGVLTAHLWEVNPEERYLTAAGFSTALTAGALLAAAGIMWGLFVYLGTQITSPSLVLVLAESRHFAEGAVGFPAAGAVIGYSLAARGHLHGWRAVVALGCLAAALQLANGVDDFLFDGVTGLLGPAAFATFLAWLVAISMALTAEIWIVRFANPAAMSSAGVAVGAAT
ncbi:MAG TPA: hypothetical protein VFL27_14080 [Candidatus Dormibacteraeota bacterium]|nr:hypothetical protein [Candidatus Dormibacteraeota bacterium]